MITKEELTRLQCLPLEDKVAITKVRIQEWYEHYNGNVYVSFSGGKDSTVLLTIARQVFSDIPAVYVDTGLEYPEIKQHVKTFEKIEIIRPKMSFREVIETYGYPVISKENSQKIYDIRNSKSQDLISKRMNGKLSTNGNLCGKLAEKWKFMLDAPFKISGKCCSIMKKSPVKIYEHHTGRHPIVGTMAVESSIRTLSYLKNGCNSFESTRPMSQPMSFWTEQDVLQYIQKYNVKCASVYGEILEDSYGNLRFSGCQRTGCMFCMYGVHMEKGKNRFQLMKETHPKIWEYCIYQLNLKQVLEYIGVEYK